MTSPSSSVICEDFEVRRHLAQLRAIHRIRKLGISVPRTGADGSWEALIAPKPVRARKRKPKPARKPAKISTTIRLSPEVLNAFKATGKGWQTRMNQKLYELVLRGEL